MSRCGFNFIILQMATQLSQYCWSKSLADFLAPVAMRVARRLKERKELPQLASDGVKMQYSECCSDRGFPGCVPSCWLWASGLCSVPCPWSCLTLLWKLIDLFPCLTWWLGYHFSLHQARNIIKASTSVRCVYLLVVMHGRGVSCYFFGRKNVYIPPWESF